VLACGVLVAFDQSWLWVLLLLLGVATTAGAVPGDRRWAGWAGWVLLTASSWARLQQADVGLLEVYTVPPALVLLAVAGPRLRRDRSFAAYRALLPGLTLALVPSVIACADGSPWRPAVLLGLAGFAVLAAAVTVGRGQAGLDDLGADLLLGVAAVLAVCVGAARSMETILADARRVQRQAWDTGGASPLRIPWYRVELWSIAGAAVLSWVFVVRRLTWSPRWRAFAGLPALLLAVAPTLVAVLAFLGSGTSGEALTGWSREAAVARVGAVLAGAGTVTVVRARFPWVPLLTRLTASTALGLTLTAAGLGACLGAGVIEIWTVSAAVVLLAVGAFRMRLQLSAWVPAGARPRSALMLAPTLLLAVPGDDVWRIVTLVVVAGGVVVAGAVRRWQAPLMLGGGVLATHAIAQLGPWMVRTVAGQPRWVALGLAGATLLTLGATYERQLRGLRSLRWRVSALR
jgi:hypothetical protein